MYASPLKFTKFFLLIISAVIISNHSLLMSQEAEKGSAGSEYRTVYENKEYKKALEIISARLDAIYKTKAGDIRPFTENIYVKKEINWKDVYESFRKRKISIFFVEDNDELHNLHIYAARCNMKTGDEAAALIHYFESLRYKHLEFFKDDVIFYEISQAYKSLGHFNAYTGALETAYTLNPENYNYSLELGTALIPTSQKEKAIFHLKRYVDSNAGDINKSLLLKLGNLYEDAGKNLETEKYYKKYLEKKGDDGYVNFALGYIAYKRTGNYQIALECLEKAIKYLPEDELYRRYKAFEYTGDIYMNNLEYKSAIQNYLNTKTYHEKIKNIIDGNNNKISRLNTDMISIKNSMDTKDLNSKYAEYQRLKEEKGKEYGIPVIHYVDALGLSMGIAPGDLGLDLRRLDVSELLKKLGR